MARLGEQRVSQTITKDPSTRLYEDPEKVQNVSGLKASDPTSSDIHPSDPAASRLSIRGGAELAAKIVPPVDVEKEKGGFLGQVLAFLKDMFSIITGNEPSNVKEGQDINFRKVIPKDMKGEKVKRAETKNKTADQAGTDTLMDESDFIQPGTDTLMDESDFIQSGTDTSVYESKPSKPGADRQLHKKDLSQQLRDMFYKDGVEMPTKSDNSRVGQYLKKISGMEEEGEESNEVSNELNRVYAEGVLSSMTYQQRSPPEQEVKESVDGLLSALATVLNGDTQEAQAKGIDFLLKAMNDLSEASLKYSASQDATRSGGYAKRGPSRLDQSKVWSIFSEKVSKMITEIRAMKAQAHVSSSDNLASISTQNS